MDTRIIQLGNSQGVRLNKQLLQQLHLKVGQPVRVEPSADGHLKISPVTEQKPNGSTLDHIAKRIQAEGGIPSIPNPVAWQKAERNQDKDPWDDYREQTGRTR